MIKSYTDTQRKREKIQAKVDKYKTAAKECMRYGNVYGVVIFTKAWRDLEKLAEEFDKIIGGE